MNPANDSLPDDPRVMQIAHDYLAELEAGRVPERRKYLDRCPELAAALAECLDGIEMVHGAGLRRRSATPPVEALLGTLGDFQIVREIGRGGMGVVYEAIQISLNRMVALKVLPFAAALDERHLQRFRNEAQAAAGLHHSHIVPVHAVGCERGVHFYAMQLIDGRPLDAVIREMRGEADGEGPPGGTTVEHRAAVTAVAPATSRAASRSGRDCESFRTAARLAADVADALEYAHQAGIVHRDIKPANLLLDAKGTIWVADFGLAHVNDVSLTRTGDVVGTLRYASPEQASGGRVLVDHRADVYSLGATLYELLTLVPMFSAQDRGGLINQILNEEPLPLRQLDRSIPVELETIVLKAVAKEPADRYASAAELADDLHRFLDEQPIRARRPSLAERARKWTKRHPSFVVAAILLLAFSTVVLGVAVALVGREQARTTRAYAEQRRLAGEAEDAAQEAREATASERKRAEEVKQAYAAERKRAKEAEDRFRLAERAVDDLIQVAQVDLRDKNQFEPVRKLLLESALAYHQEFIELHKDDPDAQAKLEENRDRVEAILHDLLVLQGDRRTFLLKEKAVLDDLALSREQRAEVEELNKRLENNRKEAFVAFHRLEPEERDRRFLELARTNEAAAAEVLTARQILRLRQIELQRQGPEAFRQADVAAALKLTAAQRSRVRALLADPWASAEKKRKSYEQIVALLTADQTASWKGMTGPPFEEPPPRPDRGWPKGKPRPNEKDKSRN